MKKLLSYLSPIVGLFLLQCQGYSQNRTQAEFDAMLADLYKQPFPLSGPRKYKPKAQKNYVLLDTREPEEYEVSHLEGALTAGYNQFDASVVKDLPRINLSLCIVP